MLRHYSYRFKNSENEIVISSNVHTFICCSVTNKAI